MRRQRRHDRVIFDRRWSEDFTVTIAKRKERQFLAAGLDPRTRTLVQVWVEERGGPWIEAPEQIEIVADKYKDRCTGYG